MLLINIPKTKKHINNVALSVATPESNAAVPPDSNFISSMIRNDGDMGKVMYETEEKFSVVLEATVWIDYYGLVVDKEE